MGPPGARIRSAESIANLMPIFIADSGLASHPKRPPIHGSFRFEFNSLAGASGPLPKPAGKSCFQALFSRLG
jgi:hypothetical protein